MVSDLVGTKGWKKLLLLWIIVFGTMVSLSRMFLGSHSADQVIYGLFNSLAALVLYRYCLQYKIYQLYKSCLRGVRTGSIMLANTFVYILVLAAPIVVYEVNTSHRVF